MSIDKRLVCRDFAYSQHHLSEGVLGSENTFEQCVSEMALAGFTGSEVGNKYPKDPEVLKKALSLRGIEICNQWFSSLLLTKPFAEVERMMEHTDPEYVNLLFDTGHFAYCGEDPLEMVRKYVGRIKHVHLKDIRPEVVGKVKKGNLSFLEDVRLGAFTVPGDGCIDFEPIFKVLEGAGCGGYMLVEAEQDPTKANPLEYALKARTFIREKTGL